MRPGWIAVVVALVGLSGCLGGGGGGEGEPEEPVDADAGGADLGTGVPAGPAGAEAPPLPPEEVAVSWDGALPATACLPTGPGSCAGLAAPPVSGRDRFHLIPEAPATWSGTLTMTWQAQGPTTADLALAFQFYESCGETCIASVGERVSVRGPSPLVLEVDALEAPAGSLGVWVSVQALSTVPDPLRAEAHAGQDVHVEGLLLRSPIRSS